MSQLVKEGEELASHSRGVVDVDQGKGLVIQAEPREEVGRECVLEDGYTDGFQGVAPRVHRGDCVGPRHLLVERDPKILTGSLGHGLDPERLRERQIVDGEPLRGTNTVVEFARLSWKAVAFRSSARISPGIPSK